ncbi:FadR/GntR family transcriptional regulator [Nocardia harenae]|uniref:FadR/GntR family transcriptional regulator n=1 Tax=Nocardia harenae TaxID=358707 RepID=UPI000B33D1B3|nr:FCD domain-containing protein [Nocardia harenae]
MTVDSTGSRPSVERVRPLKMADQVAYRIRRMIAHGEVLDGEWLPAEPEMMARFEVSRPTLREALRLLEADSLVLIRRGPPGGARITVPGPEAAASRFGLLLTLSGTTLDDVWDARAAIEPIAVRRLAELGSPADRAALAEELAVVCTAAEDPMSFAKSAVWFHIRLVELSGNRTLATVIGLLAEIIDRQLSRVHEDAVLSDSEVRANNAKALRAYKKLVRLIESGSGAEAQAFWSAHLMAARTFLGGGVPDTTVVDLLYGDRGL